MPLESKTKKFSKLPRERKPKEAFVESEYSAEYQTDLITPNVQQIARNPQALSQNNILQLQRLIGNQAVVKLIEKKKTSLQSGQTVLQRATIPTGKKLTELKKKIQQGWDDVLLPTKGDDSDDAATIIDWVRPLAAKATNMIDLMLECFASFSEWESGVGQLTASELLIEGGVGSKETTLKLIRDLKAAADKPVESSEPLESESDFLERSAAFIAKGELPKLVLDKLTPHIVTGYFNPTAKENSYFKKLLNQQGVVDAAYKGKALIKQWKDKAKAAQEEIDRLLVEVEGEAAKNKAKKEREAKIDGAAALAKPHLDKAPNGKDALVKLVWEASVSAAKANGYIELDTGPYTPEVIGRAVHAWRSFKGRWEKDKKNYPKNKAIFKSPHVPGGANFVEDKGEKTNVQGVTRSYQTDFIANWVGNKIVVHVNATGLVS